MKLFLIENDQCPYCKVGTIVIKHGKFGEFLSCNNFPYCAAKQNINEKFDSLKHFNKLK